MSNNHGLSVHTTDDAAPGAATADNRRLRRPVDNDVNNCFNDATEGEYYDFASGHQGIDFLSKLVGVKAMYGGVVVKAVDDWQSEPASKDRFLGKHVIVRSCTDPATGAGFEHTYAHLDSVAVEPGDPIRKGQVIGVSGDTGTNNAGFFHLHVHLRAFGPAGTITNTYEPGKASKPRLQEVTDVYTLVDGCMNFACFLPPNGPGLPVIDRTALRPIGKLLSPRGNEAEIPVYQEIFASDRTLLSDDDLEAEGNSLGTIEGTRLGCYAVLEEYFAAGSTEPDWYRIQYSATATGWVSRTGTVEGYDVQWVHVEEAPATEPEVSAHPYFVTTPDTPNVRQSPNADIGGGSPILGQLTANRCYEIQGTFRDPRTEDASTSPATELDEEERRWWLIDFDGRPGWVRDDEVWAYADSQSVPAAWPVAPRDPEARFVGSSVHLMWLPPSPSGAPITPSSLNVTGYRIWRYADPVDQSNGEVAVFDVQGTPTSWTDDTALDASLSTDALLYYRVAAKVDSTVGAVSGYASVAVLSGRPPGTGVSVPVASWSGSTTMTFNPGGASLGPAGELPQDVYHPAIGVIAPSGVVACPDRLICPVGGHVVRIR